MSASPTQPLSAAPPQIPAAQEPADWFGILLMLGVFTAVGYALQQRLITNSDIDLVFGIMLGWISAIVNFKWGSSSSSKTKDATIANLSNGK